MELYAQTYNKASSVAGKAFLFLCLVLSVPVSLFVCVSFVSSLAATLHLVCLSPSLHLALTSVCVHLFVTLPVSIHHSLCTSTYRYQSLCLLGVCVCVCVSVLARAHTCVCLGLSVRLSII